MNEFENENREVNFENVNPQNHHTNDFEANQEQKVEVNAEPNMEMHHEETPDMNANQNMNMHHEETPDMNANQNMNMYRDQASNMNSNMNSQYGYNSGAYRNVSTKDYMAQMAQMAEQARQRAYGGYTDMPQENIYDGMQSEAAKQAAEKAAAKVARKEEKKSRKAEIKRAKKSNHKSNGKVKKFVFKTTGILAGAAVFGLVAGGVFQLVTKDTIQELRESKENTTVESVASADTTSEGIDTSDNTLEATKVVDSGSGMDVSQIAQNAMPSVVSVYITALETYDQGIFGSYQYEAEGSGSGIIIDENDTELLIITNNHVVTDAETVKVGFIDGETYDATVKGTDSDQDLAVIAVKLSDISDDTMSQIKTATFGDSDELQVGEQVVAIGNALGYGQSVTTGIVSALNRENDTNTTPLIQTDAAINPGNSGGALLNMKGEVIGINSSKYASTEVEGMGYAIPVSQVSDTINNLINMKTREKVDEDKQGYLGIECGTVTSEMQYYYGAPAGVYVSKVTDDGAADKAGLPEDSIITKLGDKTVESVDDLTDALSYYAAGEEVKVEYSVLDGKEYVSKDITIKLGKKPSTTSEND